MSLHHAQPHKNRSFDNRESLEGSPQHTDGDHFEGSSVEASDQRISTSKAPDYDEEARFELLSAYLDDEVTTEERKLVAQWLMDDPNTQQMYQRLLMLRQAIRTAPVPTQPPLQMPTPPHQPWLTLSSWSLRQTLVCAIAIALVSSLSQLGTTSGRQQLQEAWQFIKTLPQGALLQLASTDEHVSKKASK
ncbi:MAG: hypothetical protein AAGE59_38235 [Cyanobacteria bacterium P01_F01_bin.86]